MNDFLSGLLGIGTGVAGGGLLKGAYDNLGDVGDDAKAYGDELAVTLSEMSGFRPYGVTSSIGSSQVDANGNVNMNLSDPYQQQTNNLQNYANTLFGNAMGSTDAREQDVYNRIRALQSPEEERARLALENRLAGQGRQGVSTSMYGGTPEQLAQAKAQAEAQNQASLMAIQQAQADQLQNAQIGTQFMQNQFLPYAQLGNQAQIANQAASIADVSRRDAARLFGEASMSGMEQNLAARLGQGQMLGNLGSGMLSSLFSPFQTADGGVGSLFGNAVGGVWNGIFGSD
jgi:hypothetical protein